jgi:hypothetical protein
MIDRVRRAAQLEPAVYEEVEADASLNGEALAVVVLTALLSGIGGALSGGMDRAVVFEIGAAVVGYFVWAAATVAVGRALYGATADIGEVLRTLGYASGPRALGVLSFVPIAGGLIGVVAGLWLLATGLVAIRQALDLDTSAAFVVAVISLAVVIVATILVAIPFGIVTGIAAIIAAILSS